MVKRFKQLIETETFSFFIRYFAVFTVIFGLMTLIIFQVMRSTMYQQTDQTLQRIKEQPLLAVSFAIARAYEPNSEFVLRHDSQVGPSVSLESTQKKTSTDNSSEVENLRLGLNTHVLLYNQAGEMVNPDSFTGLSDLKLDKDQLGVIHESTMTSSFGVVEDYRSVTIPLKAADIGYYSLYDVAYATILVNVSQVNSSITSYEQTVAFVMVIAWLLSLLASIYLAHLTIAPILVSYQKQTEFVENASHELRTPLAVLQNRLEGLFRHPERSILEGSESIAASLEEVRNMRLLTSNLLNLVRREDGLYLQIEAVETTYFDELFAHYQLMVEEQGQELIVENDLQAPIYTDKQLVKQLLTILVDNALKYSEGEGSIRLSARAKEKGVSFTVADNGIGISDVDKKKIFDRFYRVDKARTRQKGGFGLGLSLAQQIAQALSGHITVTDNTPKGSIFEVYVPKGSEKKA